MLAEIPLHPKLVHLPLALAALLPLLTFGVLLAWWRGWLHQRTWSVVLAVQAVLVVGSVLATRSGSNDEERVESVVPGAAIEQHEEAAETFQWAAIGLLVLGVAPLLLRNQRSAQMAALATACGSLVLLLLAIRTGEKGGELVYRHGAAAVFASRSSGTPTDASAARSDNDRDH